MQPKLRGNLQSLIKRFKNNQKLGYFQKDFEPLLFRNILQVFDLCCFLIFKKRIVIKYIKTKT